LGDHAFKVKVVVLLQRLDGAAAAPAAPAAAQAKPQAKPKAAQSKSSGSDFKKAFAKAYAGGKGKGSTFTYNGKKYAAVTKADLKKSGHSDLRSYLNAQRKKG